MKPDTIPGENRCRNAVYELVTVSIQHENRGLSGLLRKTGAKMEQKPALRERKKRNSKTIGFKCICSVRKGRGKPLEISNDRKQFV